MHCQQVALTRGATTTLAHHWLAATPRVGRHCVPTAPTGARPRLGPISAVARDALHSAWRFRLIYNPSINQSARWNVAAAAAVSVEARLSLASCQLAGSLA